MPETFGELLRRLRQQAGLSQPELARRVPVSQPSLSRYESGRQAVDVAVAARLDELLDAGGQLAALAAPADAVEVLSGDERDRLAYVTDRPRSIDSQAVRSLAVVLAEQRRLEDRLGAGAVFDSTNGYVRLVERLVPDAGGTLRPAVVELAAQWAQFGAWLHVAVDELPGSARLLDRVTEWGLEIDSVDLVATALSMKGYHAYKTRRLGAMLGLSRAAGRDPRVSPGLRALAAQQQARAHALLGEGEATDRALDEATELVGRTEPGHGPPWVYFFGPDYLRMQRGRAYRYLGRRDESAELLAAGLDALPAELRNAEWTRTYEADLAEVRTP